MNSINSEKNWELWEKAKLKFKEIALKHSKIREKNERKLLKELEDGIYQLDALISNCSDESFKNAVNEEKLLLKEQISVIYKNEFNGAFIRSKSEILTNNGNPSSNFLRMEACHAKKLIIKSIKDDKGNLTQSTNETLMVCEKFYKNLYKFEEMDDAIGHEFTENLPQVPHEIVEKCERYIRKN